MNEVVEVIESLYNTYGEDTSVVNKLMDLSSSKSLCLI